MPEKHFLRIPCLLLASVFSALLFAGAAFAAQASDPTIQGTGKYLAIAADCAACHTAKGGQPFAGGYAIESPMGAIWSSNITPSKTMGIGAYTEAQFAKALREGVTPDGKHLYPAMPYTSYAQMTDADVSALYTYFMNEVAPVEVASKETRLPFPFNIRASMAVWNLLYNDKKPFTPDAGKTEVYNRGAYLANALAHCAECHTPRTALMGADSAKPLAGGSLGSWYAPNITSDPVSGIGGWSDEALYSYLRTGHVQGKAQAAGPMAEAVEHSLQYLSDPDLHAIVAYLKQSPPIHTGDVQPRDSFGAPAAAEYALRGDTQNINPGWSTFSASCANCHGAKGEGTAEYPSLFHNTTTGADRPDNLIATILYGVHRTVDGQAIDMPPFGPDAPWTDRLSDKEIADVSNYVLTSFGNASNVVSDRDVAVIRQGGPQAPIVTAARVGLPVAVVVIVLLVAIFIVARRKRVRKG